MASLSVSKPTMTSQCMSQLESCRLPSSWTVVGQCRAQDACFSLAVWLPMICKRQHQKMLRVADDDQTKLSLSEVLMWTDISST